LGGSSAALARSCTHSKLDREDCVSPRPLALAYTIDLAFGDPEWFPHPVRFFGLLIRWGERALRRSDAGATQDLLAGAVLTAAVASVGWAMGRTQNRACQVMLAWTALATRSLLKEAMAVIQALEAGDLCAASRRVARIVGRDTEELD